MPAPIAKGIIITVSVLIAAGLAAYENPHIRQWIDHSRQKIALALHSLGDDVYPQSRSPTRDDPSMREDDSEDAQARRHQARAEILERGRLMEARKRRKRSGSQVCESSQSFDDLVDGNGNLKDGSGEKATSEATTTGVERSEIINRLSIRYSPELVDNSNHPVVVRDTLRDSGPRSETSTIEENPFIDNPSMSHYERELRESWNISLPSQHPPAPSTHESESLIDFTPTSESPPDPEISVPSQRNPSPSLAQSDYFSAAASPTSRTLSISEPEYYYAHPSNPAQPIEPATTLQLSRTQGPHSVSSAPSIAGSEDLVNMSDIQESEDDGFSDDGDGLRTPASGWTEMGSVTSSDAEH